MSDVEQKIRERAYHLWLESDCQDGNAEAHWLTAQREILAVSVGGIAHASDAKPAKAAKVSKPAPRKKRRAA